MRTVRSELKRRKIDYYRVRDLQDVFTICTSDKFWVDPDWQESVKGLAAAVESTRVLVAALEHIVGVHRTLAGVATGSMTRHIAALRALRAEQITLSVLESRIPKLKDAA